MVITHREFIRDVNPSVAFTKFAYPLQPGYGKTFPWLSQIAAQYEEYKIHALVFEYRSLCSDSVVATSTSLGMGSVVLGTNYNPTKNPFVDKRSMENYEGCTAKKPSVGNIHVVDVKKASTAIPGLKWIRTGPPGPDEDLRLYDAGVFTLATVGIPTGAVPNEGTIGELWVAYSIEFFKPKFLSGIGANLITDHYSIPLGWSGSFSDVAPFGVFLQYPAGTKLFPNALNCGATWLSKITAAGYNILNFDASCQGKYFKVDILISGTPAVNQCTIAITGGANMSNYPILKNQTLHSLATSNLAATSTIAHTSCFKCNDDDSNQWYLIYQLTSNNMMPDMFVEIFVTQINGLPQTVQ